MTRHLTPEQEQRVSHLWLQLDALATEREGYYRGGRIPGAIHARIASEEQAAQAELRELLEGPPPSPEEVRAAAVERETARRRLDAERRSAAQASLDEYTRRLRGGAA